MKPIPRTHYDIDFEYSENLAEFEKEYQLTGHYPVFAYSEFLIYDNRLREFGFTDYAINEAKNILGVESFGDEKMLVFMNTTAKNAPGMMVYDDIFSYSALMLTKIDNRGNDPYAILDMLINVFNTYNVLNQLGSLDAMYDYLEKWRIEYLPIIGKNYYLDCAAYGMLYQKVLIFSHLFGLEKSNTIQAFAFSKNPFYYKHIYVYCENNSILRTHPYFQNKLKIQLINPGLDNIYKWFYTYLKTIKPFPTRFLKSHIQLYSPEVLRRVYELEDKLIEERRVYLLMKYNEILYCRFDEPNYGFTQPNPIFPGITVKYHKDENGNITGELVGKLED